MTLYQELKKYDYELTHWHKTNSLPRDSGATVKRDLFRIFKEYDNSVRVSSVGCSKCIPIYVGRLSRTYQELKEKYHKRRKGHS